MSIKEGETSWLEGDIKEVELLVWPLADANIEDVKNAIENKDFCEYFFIGKVKKVVFSKNNPEALEIHADATLKKAFSERKLLIWSYLALNIPIDTSSIKTVADNQKIQEFITLSVERASATHNSLFIMLGLGLLLILLVGFYIRFRRGNKVHENNQDWKKIVLAAESRDEVEYIYANKDEVVKFFGGENPSLLELFKRINTHQYKKEWNEDELEDIRFVLDEIKESLQ
ncbi:hypothetical protein [Bacteriovorax sp. Seq25_V]|uniref:hypothetical protein n=1 Tax=Bacteriovorax sp. Seq25_V TaxID=1201288 RepID=UPI0018DF34A2|nr:hypothetical protein [Bacteriovorax sp. Seq25_V]